MLKEIRDEKKKEEGTIQNERQNELYRRKEKK